MLDGNKMKLLRIQNGLTQKDISEATGINIRVIKGYENNTDKFDTLSTDNYYKWINAIYTTKHKTNSKNSSKSSKKVEEN